MRMKLAAFVAIAAGCALYLTGLTGMGVVGPDEPRYAAIGQAMAQTGDWVTPTLWGKPWFEKPALLYWMTGAGNLAGLGPDLAPRLPVALLSLAFLACFWWRVRAEWGASVAVWATVLCGTSAGWLAYSHVAVTDLPMSAFYTLAVLLAIPWVEGRDRSGVWVAAACLAVAALAKALVPLALFLPVLAAGAFHRGWRSLLDWVRPAPMAAFAVIAVPWYVLCTFRNGSEFPRVLFVEQHFQRIGSAGLQHVQPWWFYLPVLLLLLFPWFPLLGLVPAAIGPLLKEARVRMLAGVVVFGVVFFSIAINKLPGYLLPLVPSVCIVLALAASRRPFPAAKWLAGSAALTGLFPAAAAVVPPALARGLRVATIPWVAVVLGLLVGAALGILVAARCRQRSFAVVGTVVAAGYLWFEVTAFPTLDAVASARPIWLETRPECAPNGASRNLLYGLYYYSGRQLPNCTVLDPDTRRVVR